MIILRTINVALMIAAPFFVAAYFINRFKSFWRIWWIGGIIFVLSQLGHIPFNIFAGKILNQTNLVSLPQDTIIIFNAIFLGLSAGIWEESSRYIGYRYWLNKPKSWQDGIVIGLGHGSLEAIILGLLAFYVLIQMNILRDMDLSSSVSVGNLEQTYQAIRSYWSANWYDTFLPVIERAMTIPIHVALTLIVIQTFRQGKSVWFWLAILFHALVDTTAVLLMSYSNIYLTELAIGFFTIISFIIIIKFKDKKIIDDTDIDESATVNQHTHLNEFKLDESEEKISNSKYL